MSHRTKDLRSMLIYDNNWTDRILIFAFEWGLRVLSLTSIWHGDGTFYSCSKYFAQLYCIFAHFEAKNKFVDNGVSWVRRTIPAAWVLMRRRRAVDYVEVFNQLIKAAQQHNFQ